MDSNDVIEKLRGEKAELQNLGVASLKLFGSTARGTAGPHSDVDFLVRFRQAPSFDTYMDLKLYLEKILGLKVDLVTEEGLRPELRSSVEKDQLLVA